MPEVRRALTQGHPEAVFRNRPIDIATGLRAEIPVFQAKRAWTVPGEAFHPPGLQGRRLFRTDPLDQPGGEITHFEVVSATQGFAVFGAFVDGMFLNTLVSFNPSTGELGAPLLEPLDTFLPHFAINSRNELYLAVNDDETPTPGVRVFDIIQEVELDQVLSGALPPVFVVFIEE